MAHHDTQGSENLYTSAEGRLDEVRRNSRCIKGVLTRYILNTRTITDGERLKRVSFGEKDKSKPHKTILLVGETGVGKSTVINAMVNYMLGVESKDRIWCEIIETKEDQTDSQTIAVTVYDVFTKHSPFSLTVIDTPGFGNAEGIQEDAFVAEGLHELFRSKDGVKEINAVCLVVTSTTSRLTDRQLYIFDAVLSLFGSDVDKNIVVFITYASETETNVISAIKKAKVVCAKTDKGEPVYFRFNNRHCQDFDNEKILNGYNLAFDLLNEAMVSFYTFLQKARTINLKMTLEVLRNRKQLTASIFNLKDRITFTELKQKELEQISKALQKYEEQKRDMNNFKYEVDEPYKVKVPIEHQWWNINTKEATCCEVCKENCHYPGCWWVRDLSWCSVMSKGKCTVCTRRCHYTNHVKEKQMYVVKTRRVKKTDEDLKRKYEEKSKEIKSFLNKVQSEKEELEKEKVRLVEECYQCVITLNKFALKIDSVSVLEHMDFLIEKVKETGKPEQVQKLDEIKKRVEAENQTLLRFIQRFWNR